MASEEYSATDNKRQSRARGIFRARW